jgi:hypothetical protein
MGAAFSLTLFAFGAILTFAIHAHPSGWSVQAVGVILMIVAVIGFAINLYREGWRRRLVEESIEAGGEPDITLADDEVVIETTPRDHVVYEVVREPVVTEHRVADEPRTAVRREYIEH